MITRTELQQISRYRDPEGHILSLVMPLSQDRGARDPNIDVKNLLREAEIQYERSRGQSLPESFEPVFEEVRLLIRDDASKFGRGIALFASPAEGIFARHSVPETVEPAASIELQADISQLVRVMTDHVPYCTCVISRDHARLFLGQFDEISEVAEVRDDEVPGQHDQGGWSQARFERHIEDHVHRHFKRVARELFELLERDEYSSLILAGPSEVVSAFKDELHPYVAERVIGDVRLLPEANINDVKARSMDALHDWVTRSKAARVDQICHEAAAQDLGVHGMTATVEALHRGQVMGVVVDSQIHSSGVVCLECEAMSINAGPKNRCSYCAGPTRDLDDIVPMVISSAFNQGAEVAVVDDDTQRDELARVGGIGALLRFRIEQQTA